MQVENESASYLKIYRSGMLNEREWEAKLNLQHCLLCPRKCGVDRETGKTGYCRGGVTPQIASYSVCFGEKRPISGNRGSGMITFSESTMGCIFSPNYPVKSVAKIVCNESDIANIMIGFQDSMCHNVNFVSSTQYIPQIVGAVKEAASMGLKIPVIYNTRCYERPEILRLLDGIVDIYVCDIKFGDNRAARFLSDAPDYTEYMKKSLREMHRQTGDLVLDRQGIAKRGIFARHVILPENLCGTGEVFRFIADEISKDTYVDVIRHYIPEWKAGFSDISGLDRTITSCEYDAAVETARSHGLYRGL